MDKEEKILALQLILIDMRGAFPSNFSDRRMIEAKRLAEELEFKAHINCIAAIEEESDWDGRHFRTSAERGGYEGMDNLHNLKHTFHDKCEEFRRLMTSTLEYPPNRFEDWKK